MSVRVSQFPRFFLDPSALSSSHNVEMSVKNGHLSDHIGVSFFPDMADSFSSADPHYLTQFSI